jgi:hypothetical protein
VGDRFDGAEECRVAVTWRFVMNYRSEYKASLIGGLAAALVLLLTAVPPCDATGRWITHLVTQTPAAGAVGKPVDTFSLPDTAGHWVWIVWFDYASGQWVYDTQNPYYFSNGTVEYRVPEFSKWYFVLFYDTVNGLYY